jgi:hypothetical protein
MKTMTKLIATSLLTCLLVMGAQAQEVDKRVEAILKEKVRTATSAAGPFDNAFKTTAHGEQKVSTITSPGREEAEGFIAINPTDSNKMVLSYMDFSQAGLSFPVYTTDDGGLTWTKSSFNTVNQKNIDFPPPGNSILGGGDPVFAYDDSGKLYFSYIYLIGSLQQGFGYFVLNWAYSLDNGATFQFEPGSNHFIGFGALNLNNGSINDTIGDGLLDRQWHAVDNSGGNFDGRLYTTGLFIPSDSTKLNGDGLILKWKDANANAFDTIQTQISVAEDAQFGNVVVDGNGHVHVSFADLTDDNIYHRVSTDGGATFSPQHLVYDGQSMFGGNPGHYIHGRENAAPNLVVAPNNTLHLTWSDFKNGTAFGYYSRSTDQGATWSTALDLGSFLDATNTDNLMPTVAVNQANNPSISWHGINASGKSIFYNVQSQDGGASFLAPTQVSGDTTNYNLYGNNTFFGDYCNAVKTGCKTFAIWSDGRNNSGPKMYIGTINHCESIGLREITPLGAGVTLADFYPNPVNDKLTIALESEDEYTSTLQLINVSGQIVWHQTQQVKQGKNTLDLVLDVPAGTYVLKIGTNQGDYIIRKIMVNK